jgi:hypothetical protein
MTVCTETQMNPKIYVGKVEDPFLIELVRQRSLLGELEKRICDVLGLDLDKPWQHDLRFSEELNYKNAKNVKTGSLVFAKENPYHSGTRLNLISDAVESFYKEKGFNISNKREEANKPSKELKAVTAIPDDYHKFVVLDIGKDNEEYSIMISQGDEYHVSISDFPQRIQKVLRTKT